MTTPVRRARWRLLPPLVAVLLVLGLAGAMAIQPTRQLLEQRDRIADMSSDLDAIQKSNRRLERRIKRLNDPDYLEKQAREAGLVRTGETTFVVMPPSRGSELRKKKDTATKEPKPALPPEPSFLESLLVLVGLR